MGHLRRRGKPQLLGQPPPSRDGCRDPGAEGCPRPRSAAGPPTLVSVMAVDVRPIDGTNFRDIVDLAVTEEQSAWIAPTARYMVLCCYGGVWHALGLYADDTPVGFA